MAYRQVKIVFTEYLIVSSQVIRMEEPCGNETQANRPQNSRDILTLWKTFPPIVGQQAPHL